MTYADKYDARKYSTYRFYRDIRRKVDVNAQIGRLYPNVLDHVVLDDDDIDSELIAQLTQSPLIDDAAASIQRFASRCLAADKSESMVNALSQVMGGYSTYSKPIIDILLFYGAKLDPNSWNYLDRAYFHGVSDVVQLVVNSGSGVTGDDLVAAILSGNCDTIKLVHSAYRESVNFCGRVVELINATVESMELLLSLGIIQRRKYDFFSNIPSFSVLQWILDHHVMEHDDAMIDIASNASRYSGHYFDMLRYLIEQRNFTVPRDVFLNVNSRVISDLDVFDCLISHGADVNAGCLERSPMLIRYWMDNELVVQSNDVDTLFECIRQNMTVPVLEMMIDKYLLNVNAEDDDGYVALHVACQCNEYEVVEMLIRLGADANKRSRYGVTPCDMTSDCRIRQMLIEHGYKS